MSYFYSPATAGFYSSDIHGGAMPADVRPVDDDVYAELLGKTIGQDADGNPIAIEPVIDPKVAIQAEIDQLERDSMTNRGARELQLAIMRQQGAANGLQTDEAIAAKVIYFAKLLALDTQIRALRAQL